MVDRHSHEERHFGLAPSDQLGASDGNAGWVLSDVGDNTAEWIDPATLSSGTGILVVDVATTASVDIAGGDLDGPTVSVDGIGGLSAGARVLVKDGGPTAVENGIYEITAGAPIRAADSDTGAEIEGSFVIVKQGDENANSLWHNTNLTTPTVGVSNITYASIGTLAQVLRAGNDPGGLPIHATDDGSSIGADLSLTAAIGTSGGDAHLTAGNASGGETGAALDLYGGTTVQGGDVGLYAGNGIAGEAGGDILMYAGTGDGGADDSAGVEFQAGSGAGADGKVKVYTAASYGTAYQVLTAEGTGDTAIWQDIDGGAA